MKLCSGLAGSLGAKDMIPDDIFHWVLLDKVNTIMGALLQWVLTVVLLISLLKKDHVRS